MATRLDEQDTHNVGDFRYFILVNSRRIQELSTKSAASSPLFSSTMDMTEPIMQRLYTAVEQARDDLRSCLITQGNFYQNWASRHSQECQLHVNNVQRAYITLQDQHQEVLAVNAMLRRELEESRQTVRVYREEVQKYREVDQNAVEGDTKEVKHANENELISHTARGKQSRTRTRTKRSAPKRTVA